MEDNNLVDKHHYVDENCSKSITWKQDCLCLLVNAVGTVVLPMVIFIKENALIMCGEIPNTPYKTSPQW